MLRGNDQLRRDLSATWRAAEIVLWVGIYVAAWVLYLATP